MRETCAFLAPLLFAWAASLHAQDVRPDSDDRSKLATLFASAVNNGGKVTIPPGDYFLDGNKPIPLRSEMTVTAYGARFSRTAENAFMKTSHSQTHARLKETANKHYQYISVHQCLLAVLPNQRPVSRSVESPVSQSLSNPSMLSSRSDSSSLEYASISAART